MKITRVEARPLRLKYTKPYHWAQGVNDTAEVVLVCVHTDQRITGYGESLNSGSATSVQSLLQRAGGFCVGQNPFQITTLYATR
jgi:L-alanine-DL-glutamate epimerase-like enolase superfamily enzyme